MLAVEAVLQPEQQVHFEVEADALVLLGEAALGDPRLAPCEHGRPDGAYARGDASERYDEGQERLHCAAVPPGSPSLQRQDVPGDDHRQGAPSPKFALTAF